MKAFMACVSMLLMGFATSANDCGGITQNLADTWNVVTKLVDLCQNPYSDKPAVRRVGHESVSHILEIADSCKTHCQDYPKNLETCRKSAEQAHKFDSFFRNECY